MDSQGRKVVVCDNGTGVSLTTCTTVRISRRLALGSPKTRFNGRKKNSYKQEVAES